MYLSEEVHTVSNEFHLMIGLLHKANFKDCKTGTPVIMGLGLLLCNCWRALEVEPDADVLSFLQNLRLGMDRALGVLSVIKKVLGRKEMDPNMEE